MPRLEFTTEGYPFYTTDDDIVAARDYVSRLPVELPQNLIGEKTGQAITNLVAPVGETPRFQTWPEKIVRSGATLPGDVASGRIPLNLGLRREDFTDIPDVQGKSDTWLGKKLGLSEGQELGPSGELIERTQDLSGMAGGGSLATAKGATLGSGPVQRAYHGTSKPGFEKFNLPKSDEFMIDRALGVHVSKDPEIASTFAIDRPGQRVESGGVYAVDIPYDAKFLQVDQPLLPYITDKNTPKHAKNVHSDQSQIEQLVMKTAFEKDPELLARYLVQARGVKSIAEALPLAKDMAAGKKVELPVDGPGYDIDRFVRNFGGRPYDRADSAKAVEIFKKEMQNQGYVGIKYINTSPMETATAKDPTSYILFNPREHVRNAITGQLMSDTSASAPVSALAKAPVFYSAVEHAINNSKTKTASAEQWLGEIRNQPGVKQEELDWVLHELPKGQISKQELEAFVREHKVELKEVNLGEMKFNEKSKYNLPAVKRAIRETGDNPGELELTLANDGGAYRALTKKFPELAENEDWARVVANDFYGGDTKPKGTTKYSQWQLPGGENYREMLLSLPEKNFLSDWQVVSHPSGEGFAIKNVKGEYGLNANGLGVAKFKTENSAKGAINDYAHTQNNNFTSSHWSESNVLAHIRTNERDIPGVGYSVQNTRSGNKSKVFATREEAEAFQKTLPGSIGTKVIEDSLPTKTLHVEEIQSDWHQKGRKEGYKGEKEELQSKFDKIEEKIMKSEDESILANPELKDALKTAVDKGIITKDEAKVYQRYTEIESGAPVPDAPFKSNWADLALKRIIRQAVDEGKDAISWTPGEAQAARYDLSKHIDNLEYGGSAKVGDGWLTARDKNNNIVMQKKVAEKDLADHIGKEAAEKLLKQTPKNEFRYLENADLKIGGEGMKAFYDKMLVDKANAIVKKFGGKVEQGEIPGKGEFKYSVIDGHGNILRQFDNGFEAQKFVDESPRTREIQQEHVKKAQPIHILKITPQLRDAAMNKGFSLFADTGKVGAPLAALTKVEHNPFTTDAYHGTRKFRGSKIEPKIAYEIHDNNGTFSVWDKTLKRTISPELKTEAEAKAWVDKRVGSEFFSAPNSELAGEYGIHVLPLKLDTRDYHTFDAKGGNWQYANKHAIFEAEQLGKKGVIIKNVVDNAGGKDFGPQTVNITLDPSTVRSKFAKFDPAKFGESGLLKSDTEIGAALTALAKKWDEKGVRNYTAQQSEGAGGNIKLHDLVVPKDKRGQGVGTEFMTDLVNLADEAGKKIVVTAAKDYGATSLDRLKSFYKQFGFVENKGRSKDFRISDNMYRNPIMKAGSLPIITDKDGNILDERLQPIKSRDEQTASGALLPTHEGDKPVDLPSGKTLGLAAAKAAEYGLWAARPSLGPALWGTSAIVGAAMNAAPKKEIKTLNKVKLIPIKGDPWQEK